MKFLFRLDRAFFLPASRKALNVNILWSYNGLEIVLGLLGLMIHPLDQIDPRYSAILLQKHDTAFHSPIPVLMEIKKYKE
jgi:hypothetical protein